MTVGLWDVRPRHGVSYSPALQEVGDLPALALWAAVCPESNRDTEADEDVSKGFDDLVADCISSR